MKKFLCALLSAITALCAVGVSGCGGKENPPTSSPTASDSTVAETVVPSEDAEMTAKVMSVNIAYPKTFEKSYIKYKGQTPDDYTMQKRFNRLCTLVSYHTPDVILLQEVNGKGAWWDYLISGEDSFLKRYTKYDFVGRINLAGGTDGSGSGNVMYNQVYYNTNKFEFIAGGTFFCRNDKTSPENYYTGDYEGVYENNNTTTCSYAVLRDKKSLVTAVYATTHLCTRGSEERCFRNYGQARNLTEGLYDIAMQYKWGDEALPIVVGGDFNGAESHTSFYAYPHMVNDAHYNDSQKVAAVTDNSGTARIFGASVANNGSRIDYIFSQGAEVPEYKVLSGTFIEDKAQTYCEYNPEAVLDGTEYDLTDHLPVFAKIKFNGKSKSVAPDDYVNPCISEDTVVETDDPMNATSTKIVFDSTKLLPYIGNNSDKGMTASIVEDGDGVKCVRLTAEKSFVAPRISIDYGVLMTSLGIPCASANEYRKIKVEYKYCATKASSLMHFGASTAAMVPVSIGVNTAEMQYMDGTWQEEVFDFTEVDDAFWVDGFTYLAFTTGVGLMGGDSIYIRSIEFVK